MYKLLYILVHLFATQKSGGTVGSLEHGMGWGLYKNFFPYWSSKRMQQQSSNNGFTENTWRPLLKVIFF